MPKKITSKKITKNILLSISSQIISLVVSFLLGFIVPKYISELQYSFWQIYLLYVGYTGILHFGLLDGIILRYSQYDFEELDKAKIRSQFQILLAFTSIIAVLICIISCQFLEGRYFFVVVFVAAGIITKNLFSYTSFTFQMTNRIKFYALVVIVQRLVYMVFVIILLLLRVQEFYLYCIADLVGDICGFFVGIFFNKGMYFGKVMSFKEAISECKDNISSGIIITISYYSSILLIGGAKMIIQWNWGELIFGKMAFSFNVTNLFLTFVTAVSVVLFPSLKRIETEDLPNLYLKIRNLISPLLFLILLLFYPLCAILKLWLPQYSESLIYLGMLLPIIIFSSKVGLLTDNYLKVYHREKIMLLINFVSLIMGVVLFCLAAFVFNNLEFLLISVVITIMLRSIVSEIIVLKIINRKIIFDFFVEFFMTAIFIVCTYFLPLLWGCLVYFCALIIYLIINRKSVIVLLKRKLK